MDSDQQVIMRSSRLLILGLLVCMGGGGPCSRTVAAEETNAPPGLCAALVDGTGYPCIEHTVQTADGYLLGVQNIPHGSNGSGGSSRRAVFLQHGLIQGGDDWVINSPQESLAYIMADAGYDVWIGNTRNTRWSHGHATLSNQSQAYWNFTWDELATYDLPAALSYVYKQTNNTKLYYVGHSLGTLIALAALSESESGVGDNLQAVALLSPIAYVGNITSVLIQASAHLYIDKILVEFGITEFSFTNPAGLKLLSLVCGTPGVDCADVLSAITGKNCCFNNSRIPYYLQFEPQSTSLKTMAHLAQMVRGGTLAKYDYGPAGNQMTYSQPTPPSYDLGNIDKSLPMFISYGGNDALADPQDVTLGLLPKLSSQVEDLYLPQYAHADYPFGTEAYIDVYPKIISFFQAH